MNYISIYNTDANIYKSIIYIAPLTSTFFVKMLKIIISKLLQSFDLKSIVSTRRSFKYFDTSCFINDGFEIVLKKKLGVKNNKSP